MRTAARTAGVVIVAAIGLAHGAAGAAPAAELEPLLRELDHPSFARREAATRALAQPGAFGARELEAALVRPDLTPEQRCRVLAAARDLFLSTPRAAIGVQFVEGNAELGPYRIQVVYGEFPSSRVLRAGDEIVAVGGMPVGPGAPAFRRLPLRAYVISREPGETVVMGVRRGAEVLELPVTLGSFGDFPSNPGRNDPQMPDLLRAWDVRLASMPGPADEPAPVRTGLSASEWWPESGAIAQLRRTAGAVRDVERPWMLAGGEPTGCDPADGGYRTAMATRGARPDWSLPPAPGGPAPDAGPDPAVASDLRIACERATQLRSAMGEARQSPWMPRWMRHRLQTDLASFERSLADLSARAQRAETEGAASSAVQP